MSENDNHSIPNQGTPPPPIPPTPTPSGAPYDSNNPMLKKATDNPQGHKNVTGDPSMLEREIPEAVVKSQTINLDGNSAPMPNAETPKQPEMSDAEKEVQAKQSAAFILDRYSDAHDFGKYLAKIDEDKLNKIIIEQDLDDNKQMPINSRGETADIHELTENYNDNIDATLTVTKKFREEVTPPLERILKKNNAFISDEMQVASLFARDIGVKVVMVFSFRKGMNQLHGYFAKSNAEVFKQTNETIVNAEAATPPPTQPNNPQYSDEPNANSRDMHEAGEYIAPIDVPSSTASDKPKKSKAGRKEGTKNSKPRADIGKSRNYTPRGSSKDTPAQMM